METSSQFQGIISEAAKPQLEEVITEDGILCLILSFLTLKEAVRTSVLSTRWRHIWTRLTKFDFDAIGVLDSHSRPIDGKEAYDESKGKGKADKFIRSVDSVLHHLQGAKLDRFLVQYFLNKSYSTHLDSWVHFAIASKAKDFGLHLFRYFTDPNKQLYDFPSQLLRPSTSIEILTLSFCSLKLPPCKLDGLSCLQVLVLINVDINDEDLYCILSSCSPTLMNLILCNIRRLASISAPYHLTHLKKLKVLNCCQLRKIEINTVNLVKLEYRGVPLDFRFGQSLRLIYANICFRHGRTVNNLDFYLTKLSSSLPCLQSLTLSISNVSKVSIPKGSSRFLHLKRLDLEWDFGVEMSLHHLITLLDAAPFLRELKLCLSKGFKEQPLQTPSKEMLSRPPHTHLKAIRVSEFYFEMWQIDIVAYLLNNATELESMGIERGRKFSCSVSKVAYERCKQILSKEVRANVIVGIL